MGSDEMREPKFIFKGGPVPIWTGIALALLYWMLESLMHVVILGEGDLASQIFTPDPHEAWTRLLMASLFIAFGTYLHFAMAKRRRAEEALRQSEDFLRSVFNGIQDGISVLDGDLNIIQVNEWIESMYAAQKPLIGRKCYTVYQQRQSPCPWCPSLRTLATGDVHNEVVPYPSEQDPTGWIALSSYPLKDTSGRVTGIIEHVEDITELRQTEEELKQLAAQLSLLNDIGGKIATELDLDTVLERAAYLVRESFGYHHAALFTLDREHEELVMKTKAGSFARLFPPGHRLKLGQGMVGWAAQSGETLLANDVDAEPHYVNLYPDLVLTRSELSVPIQIGAEVVGVLDIQSPQLNAYNQNDVMAMETLADQVAVAIKNARLYETAQRELVERRRTEKRLEHYAAELERSNQELQHFAYVASHDLREPLRMVTSYVKLLERRYKDRLDADANDFIAYAVDGAARMNRLIEDLLSYSRVGTHGKPFVPTDSSAALQNALSNLGVAIEESGAVVTQDPLPTVMADEMQLAQVFQNLVGNAIKFHKKEEPPHVHISAEAQEDQWLFSVRDNGIGIDPTHHERIFLIFQRLHTREEYPGTGIGLAVCKRIVERHGGRIWVESEPDKGSTFYFIIPKRSSP